MEKRSRIVLKHGADVKTQAGEVTALEKGKLSRIRLAHGADAGPEQLGDSGADVKPRKQENAAQAEAER